MLELGCILGSGGEAGKGVKGKGVGTTAGEKGKIYIIKPFELRDCVGYIPIRFMLLFASTKRSLLRIRSTECLLRLNISHCSKLPT